MTMAWGRRGKWGGAGLGHTYNIRCVCAHGNMHIPIVKSSGGFWCCAVVTAFFSHYGSRQPGPKQDKNINTFNIVYIDMYIHLYTHTHTYIYIYIFMYVYIYIYIHIYIYVCVLYIYIYIYVIICVFIYSKLKEPINEFTHNIESID